MKFLFPRSSRLQRGWEFDQVFRTGNRLKGELVRMLFVETPGGETRLGLAVGKRQGKSHERNRGRRILKEGLRRLLPWIKEGYWMVFSLSNRGMTANARDIYEDLGKTLRKHGFMTEEWPGLSWDCLERPGAEEP